MRDALWGGPNAFDVARQPFAAALQELSAVRVSRPELRYGRQYFRHVSGDGTSFGHSPFDGGVTAFSRILAASKSPSWPTRARRKPSPGTCLWTPTSLRPAPC